MAKIFKSKNIIKVCILLLYANFLFLPIVRLISRVNISVFNEVVGSSQFKTALYNSITTSLAASVISLLLALIFSYCIERSNIRYKNIYSYILVLPMLLPSISHSFGLVSLFGSNGFLTKIFKMNIGIYGFKGIIMGSVMYSFPIAFIMIKNILSTENGSSYEALEIFGINKFKVFVDVTFPYIKRTLLLAFFAVFTMIVTDYGVPLMIGAKTITLPVLMYNKTVAMIDYNSGSVISLFLLIPAFIAFILDSLLTERKNNQFVTNKMYLSTNSLFNIISTVVSLLASLFVILPIIALSIMFLSKKYPIDLTFTLAHVNKTIERGALVYLRNSIIIAIVTSIIGVILSFICAYFTTRIKGKFSKLLHICSIISMAVPGIIIGFSYMISFKNSFIYGTMLILCIVNIVHFNSSPYIMCYNELLKVNTEIENVGLVLGISRISIIFNVIIPKVKNAIIEMFSYYFVNSMMTISAVAFLSPPSPKPVSLMINQFEAQLLMESAAFVTVLILLINIILKLLLTFIKSSAKKR